MSKIVEIPAKQRVYSLDVLLDNGSDHAGAKTDFPDTSLFILFRAALLIGDCAAFISEQYSPGFILHA